MEARKSANILSFSNQFCLEQPVAGDYPIGMFAWDRVTDALTPARGYAVPALLFALVYIVSGLIEFLHYFYRGLGRSDVESSLTLWQRSTTPLPGMRSA